jgi:recombination protein RecT
MITQAAAPTNALVKRREDVRSWFTAVMPQLQEAMPKHLAAGGGVQRLIRVALTACVSSPKLLECSKESLLKALMQAAQLGLEPDGLIGQGYLIPYKVHGVMVAQFQPGYQGLLDLARRSDKISTIDCGAVHRKDEFEYWKGLEKDHFKHVPFDPFKDLTDEQIESLDTAKADELRELLDPGPLTHVYAIGRLKDGGVNFKVMNRAEVERIRRTSRAADDGPWITHYEAMALKTVLKQLYKLLPRSIDDRAVRAVASDDLIEAGIELPPATPEEALAGNGGKGKLDTLTDRLEAEKALKTHEEPIPPSTCTCAGPSDIDRACPLHGGPQE